MSTKSKLSYERMKNYIIYDVFGANDSAHKIALGCAIGMFVAFTPTMPFQMMLTVFLSWTFRANMTVGVPLVWITNPVTIIPIYLPQYLLGCLILGVETMKVDFAVLTTSTGSLKGDAIKAWDFMVEIFWPLWTGSLIISTALAAGTYFAVFYGVKKYRKTHPVQIHQEAS